MDELRLIEKLKLIEAVFSGASTEGERVAAERARERILERLLTAEREDPATEYRFSMTDLYSRQVFVALCRRYGLKPYRYKRQRYTTVMLRVSPRFVDETLWPQFEQISDTLHGYLTEVTKRVVGQVLDADQSEATVVEEGGQLPLPENPPKPPVDDPAPSRPAAGPEAETGSAKDRQRQKRRDKKRKKKRRGK